LWNLHPLVFFSFQVGEAGLVVGVEHIPELVERSIDAIKQTPAGELMDKGRIVVLGKQNLLRKIFVYLIYTANFILFIVASNILYSLHVFVITFQKNP